MLVTESEEEGGRASWPRIESNWESERRERLLGSALPRYHVHLSRSLCLAGEGSALLGERAVVGVRRSLRQTCGC